MCPIQNGFRDRVNLTPIELSQLRVTVVRSENVVAKAGDISGTQRKGPPLEAATNQRLVKTKKTLCVCCSYSDLWSV
jgi:hypothetical protein